MYVKSATPLVLQLTTSTIMNLHVETQYMLAMLAKEHRKIRSILNLEKYVFSLYETLQVMDVHSTVWQKIG